MKRDNNDLIYFFFKKIYVVYFTFLTIDKIKVVFLN